MRCGRAVGVFEKFGLSVQSSFQMLAASIVKYQRCDKIVVGGSAFYVPVGSASFFVESSDLSGGFQRVVGCCDMEKSFRVSFGVVNEVGCAESYVGMLSFAIHGPFQSERLIKADRDV